MVGDRRILRFLRGKQLNIDESSKMFIAFLQWRLDSKIDAIRNDILYNNRRSPLDFPHGKTIIDLAPQIVITANATDRKGQPLGKPNDEHIYNIPIPMPMPIPIYPPYRYPYPYPYPALECYDFVPREVFKVVTRDEYLHFLIYCLEYRAMVMEQLSHEAEKRVKGMVYGVLCMVFVVCYIVCIVYM
ncbi:hypothetical protein EON63_13760 [archaeon]|nr:MAG: hypothetical protein EON63_13760 [archaeon]